MDIIQKYLGDEQALLKFAVNRYCMANGLEIQGNVLEPYKLSVSDNLLLSDIHQSEACSSIEDIIEVFGDATTEKEKKKQGVVYTPSKIRKFIVGEVLDKTQKELSECLCADISCGCGAFLFTLLDELRSRSGMPCRQILHNLYGVDISIKQIRRTSVILALASLAQGEVVNWEDLNLEHENTLMWNLYYFEKPSESKGFDVIVGNPPYSTSRNLNEVGKYSISRWLTGQGGKADLYIPFFEAGMKYLAPKGILGYITVNSFFKSVNARSLRKFFVKNSFAMSIVDFGNRNVFPGVLSYNCITLMGKEKSPFINYAKASLEAIGENGDVKYNEIPYSSLDTISGWNLGSGDELENIRKIENTGQRLGERYSIRNGIATCANDIFIFKPVYSDLQYNILAKNGREYMIETGICREIIKPNKLRTEDDIPFMMEKIIFPYDENCEVLNENTFRSNYPCAYEYLSTFKDRLLARDKGKKVYKTWYAYGRTQNMKVTGCKLLFPTLSDAPRFIFSSQKDLLLYNGNAIYGEYEDELLVLKRVLESSVFDYYVRHTSKPYSSGYYSLAKSYIENFSICPLTDLEKKALLKMNKPEVDKFLENKYAIKI